MASVFDSILNAKRYDFAKLNFPQKVDILSSGNFPNYHGKTQESIFILFEKL